MRKTFKNFLLNLILSFVSLILLFIVSEFFVFRFVLVASDMPTPDFINDIVRFQKNQEGIYRVKNEIKAKFKINSNGWNSGHQKYSESKDSNIYRVAIIGDSYISAFQVAYNKSVAERLEAKLASKRFQVYRFGIDGAPLSQYLHMLRREVVRYAPDLIIVNLVHNDFSESYEFKPGVYTSSFMKLKLENGIVTEEKNPTPYESPWYNWIRESATWRYFAYRQKVRFNILRNIILGKKSKNKHQYQANIDISLLDKNTIKNKVITNYILRSMRNICDTNKIRLLLLMNADCGSIYKRIEDTKLYETGALKLNRMVADIAQKYNIDFLDLHKVFSKNYLVNKKRFRFKYDGHWNSYAHEVVADTLSSYIRYNIKPPFLSK